MYGEMLSSGVNCLLLFYVRQLLFRCISRIGVYHTVNNMMLGNHNLRMSATKNLKKCNGISHCLEIGHTA